MYLASLWLTDFRCYEEATLRFPPGVTVICGANAQGKTSLLEAVEAKYEGTELTVAFNSQFLLDGIDAAATDEVVIESIDPLKPAVMKAMDSGDFLYLLMPVRIA